MKTPTLELYAGSLVAFLSANLRVRPLDIWTVSLKNGTTLTWVEADVDVPVFQSRNSIATYVDTNGIIQTAQPNYPRYVYDSAQGLYRLMMEGSDTNLLLQSAALDTTANWTRTAVNVAANATLGPDGTQSMEFLSEDTTNAFHQLGQSVGGNFAANSYYAFSIFAKVGVGTRNIEAILSLNAGGFAQASFTVSGSAISFASVSTGGTNLWANLSGYAISLGVGFYRLVMIAQTGATAGAGSAVIRLDNNTGLAYAGDGVSGHYFWGAQLELGAQESSYIPTTTAAVTRAADVATTYTRGPAIQRTNLKNSVGVNVDTMNVDLFADQSVKVGGIGVISSIALGYWDGAYVQLDHAFFDANMNLQGIIPAFYGNVGQVQTERGAAHIEVRSIADLLNIQVPGDLYQPGCKNTVFDSYCKLVSATYTNSLTVNAGYGIPAANDTFGASGSFSNPGVFNMGLLTITSGANAGVSRTVKAAWSLPGGIGFNVLSPFPSKLLGGESFTVRQGCDKTLARCNQFGNKIHFRGEPFIPAPETVT